MMIPLSKPHPKRASQLLSKPTYLNLDPQDPREKSGVEVHVSNPTAATARPGRDRISESYPGVLTEGAEARKTLPQSKVTGQNYLSKGVP